MFQALPSVGIVFHRRSAARRFFGLAYLVRILRDFERLPLKIHFGVAQAIANTALGVDLQASGQFAMGVSYQF